MPMRPIEWIVGKPAERAGGHVRMIDQTALPSRLDYIEIRTVDAMCEAIRMLRVRGAPAIGVAAAMGVVLAAQNSKSDLLADIEAGCDKIAATRPTAVNLFKAIDRMRAAARRGAELGPDGLKAVLLREAAAIFEEDRSMCREIGRHGASLLSERCTILTHCNAGSLATSEYGTALAAVYVAVEQGKTVSVYADETRPLLQGSRLTAWELTQTGIETTVICDNMAAQVMREGKIDAVLVGADRIAANGDTANKIGTYGVAILARFHRIPFYVLAPTSTFDMSLSSGSGIPIEQRGADEIVRSFGTVTAPVEARVYSPAFDVTPADLITAIVCEKGIARPDYRESLKDFSRST